MSNESRCRTEHALLLVGLIILAFPYFFYHSETTNVQEGSFVISRVSQKTFQSSQNASLPTPSAKASPSSPKSSPKPPPSLPKTSSSFPELDWSRLAWRPDPKSACVRSYQWTNKTEEISCPIASTNVSGQPACGGVIMSGCASYVSGEFVPAKATDQKPAKLWAPVPTGSSANKKQTVFCSQEKQVNEGKYQEDPKKRFYDENVWIPSNNCSLLPLDLSSLAKLCEGSGSVVFLGDSHIRNSFTAFVAGLRQREFFLETHDDVFKNMQGVLVYRVEKTKGKIMDHRGVVLLANHTGATLHDEIDCDQKSELCLQVLFFWGATFTEQIALLPIIRSLHPALLVISPGNSYEGVAFPKFYESNLTAIAQALPKLKFHFNSWPYGNRVSGQRVTLINTWRSTLSNKVHIMDHGTFGNYGGMQGSRNWHYACAGRHNDQNLLKGVVAEENCTDVVDTSMARVMLTLAVF